MNFLDEAMLMHDRELSLKYTIPVSNPTFLPIHLTGGIGDVICCLDALSYLAKHFDIMLYTKHVEVVNYFAPHLCVQKNLPFYTWHLEFDTFAKFVFNEGFYGFLMQDHKELYLRQRALFEVNHALKKLIHTCPEKYFLIPRTFPDLNKRISALYSLGYNVDFDPAELYSGEMRANYITIHDGYDSQVPVSGRSTKTWKWNHWNELIQKIRKQYPMMNIIQLGSTTSRPIDGVDQCLINATTIEGAFTYLSQSKLHIDGDSGLVHAATKLGTPCVVMWGPTPHLFYGYGQNHNIRNSSLCSGGCYGLKPNWNDKCPLVYDTPKCMDSIEVDEVFEAVKKAL